MYPFILDESPLESIRVDHEEGMAADQSVAGRQVMLPDYVT